MAWTRAGSDSPWVHYMNIVIIDDVIAFADVRELAKEFYLDMIKGVADIEREIIALGGEYHIDANNVLTSKGSEQANLWGFNVHLEKKDNAWIECRSLINIRPAVGNRGMLIEDALLEKRVRTIVEKRILRV